MMRATDNRYKEGQYLSRQPLIKVYIHMAKLTPEDVLKKLPSAELKALSASWSAECAIDDEITRRNALKAFKERRLIDLADLLEGKGKFKNRGVSANNFDMGTFFRVEDSSADALASAPSAAKAVELGCGFAACACGHAGLHPEFRRQGFCTTKSGEELDGRTYYSENVTFKDSKGNVLRDFEAASAFFGIVYADAEKLFSYQDRLGKKGNSPAAVANRIREFVKAQKVEAAALARMDKAAKNAVARKAAARKAAKEAKKTSVTAKSKKA